MPLYMLLHPSKKGRVRGTKGLRDHMRSKRAPPNPAAPSGAVPCYTVDAPQEFDEEGKELGLDAQVWKTYVREADQVDEELVDGWNKSMDVILIFAALFSAISTAFVIESYKNLKQDSADASSQTLLTISQTLAFIANGSQPTAFVPASKEESPFKASAKAICVNVLWFLSLSLSVAVSLISMLAKEWCLEFMAGRTGPPGAQARRRQQRWDGLVKWRMKEVIVMLPSLIHLALLLFAIGLCVFLWDVHFGVAIPVVVVTTLATGTYLACTVLPFFHDFCPYGTVISRSLRQFINLGSRPAGGEAKQDEVTARAICWMIVNCETPRSVDVALQSLAGAEETLPHDLLQEFNAWTMIKRRLDSTNALESSGQNQTTASIYERALQAHLTVSKRADRLLYGVNDETRRLEQLALSIQSCMNSVINEITSNPGATNQSTKEILERCSLIAPNYLEQRPTHPLFTYYGPPIGSRELDPEKLVEDLLQLLEQYHRRKVNLDPMLYHVLSANLAFALCCNASRGLGKVTVNAGYIVKLFQDSRAGPQLRNTTNHMNLVLGTLWLVIAKDPSLKPDSPTATYFTSMENALETLWAGMMITMYSDNSTMQRLDTTYLVHGMLHLLANPSHYGLSADDSYTMWDIIMQFKREGVILGQIQSSYHVQYTQDITRHLTTITDVVGFTPQFLSGLSALVDISPWEKSFLLPTPEIYLFLVNACLDDPPYTGSSPFSAITYSPFPSLSPHLLELVSTRKIMIRLVDSENDTHIEKRAFAITQLWLLLDMSLRASDRTSPALNTLEEVLLQYPRLEHCLENQEQVAEELEIRLSELLDQLNLSHRFYPSSRYLHRVFEVMLQRRCAPLPEEAHNWLRNHSERLRGLTSFVNLETERTIVYPDGASDSGEVLVKASNEVCI